MPERTKALLNVVDRVRRMFQREPVEVVTETFSPEEQIILRTYMSFGGKTDGEILGRVGAFANRYQPEESDVGTNLKRFKETCDRLLERGYLELVDSNVGKVRRITPLGRDIFEKIPGVDFYLESKTVTLKIPTTEKGGGR